MKIAPPRYVGYGRVPDAFANPWQSLADLMFSKACWVPLVGSNAEGAPRADVFFTPETLTSQLATSERLVGKKPDLYPDQPT